MDAKKALTAVNGDIDAALEYLKKHGQKIAAQKQDRAARDGMIGTYLHANKKLAALVLLACETDFVAKTEDFQNLAHDIAMQVAAMDPQYIRPEDVPVDVIEKEKEIFRAQLKQEGKPEKMWDTIIEGKLKKYYTDVCLLYQPFVKDEDKTINDLVTAVIAKLGENIQVKKFTRVSL